MKLKLLLILSLITLGYSNGSAKVNNNPGTAITLPLNGSISGDIKPAGDDEWYTVTTTTDGELNLTLNPANSKYFLLSVYDSDATTQLGTAGDNTLFTLNTNGLAKGTFYVEVSAFYSGDTGSFVLQDSLILTGVPNDHEPNNNYAEADPLSLDTTVTGHIGYYYNLHKDTFDWYKIITPGTGNLLLKNISVNGHALECNLYDSTATNLINDALATDTLIFTTTNLHKGTYYVRISTYYGGDYAPYTLTDSSTATAGINTLNMFEAEKLNIYPNPSSSAINVSYYLNKNATVTLQVITVLGQVVSFSDEQETGGEQLRTIDLSALPTGLYFVRLISNSYSVTTPIIRQ